jgi:hypothetical protein
VAFPSGAAALNDASGLTHVLYHDDLSALPLDFNAGGFRAISRGLGKYLEVSAPGQAARPAIHTFGNELWRDYRFRAVVTPVSFEHALPMGSFCGIVAHYKHAQDYLALVLSRDGQLKLLRRTAGGFDLLAFAALEFCIGQSLSLTLTVRGGEITGTAGPYSGATTIRAQLSGRSENAAGKVGFISAAHARFGPHTVECSPEESLRIAKAGAETQTALEKKRANFPRMKLERTVPLYGRATRGNVLLADINGDGKLEILAAQSSKKIATRISLTSLTCLTALDLDGSILWQAGIPDPEAADSLPVSMDRLPFRFHDLFGDGHPVVVCVFGYDLQIRDAKTGNVLMSAQTPSTLPVSDEFKAVTAGGPWGDETLNMDVAAIDFCDTQGSGGKKEIVLRDNYNLAVLDPLAEPALHAIFRHRGNVRGGIWIGDIDEDGKDEIFAGCSFLDDDGALKASLKSGATETSLTVVDPLDENGTDKRAYISAKLGGLLVLSLKGFYANALHADEAALRIQHCSPGGFNAGKFRADLAGLQFAALEEQSVTFLDAGANRIWSREFEVRLPQGGAEAHVLNWTNRTEKLLVLPMRLGGGLIDGHGDVVVEFPSGAPKHYCGIIKGYCTDGRDAILAWDADKLEIYTPADVSQ